MISDEDQSVMQEILLQEVFEPTAVDSSICRST
jgi:hypothetical protein